MKDFFARVWGGFFAVTPSGTAELWGNAEEAEARAGAPRGVVILVHGIHDTARSMEPLAKWLRSRGWEAHTLSLHPNDGSVGLEVLAGQLAQFVEKSCPVGAKVNLVGFSMGGLVSRYYVQRLGGADRVERLVTISAPHHGTWLAFLHGGAGAVQMRPRSAFLRALNEDRDWLKRVRVTTLWTPLDLMILPAWSSRLDLAREGRHWVLAHPLMVLQRSMWRAVEAALSQ